MTAKPYKYIQNGIVLDNYRDKNSCFLHHRMLDERGNCFECQGLSPKRMMDAIDRYDEQQTPKVIWTPALLADAINWIISDKEYCFCEEYFGSDGERMRKSLKCLALALRERAKKEG